MLQLVDFRILCGFTNDRARENKEMIITEMIAMIEKNDNNGNDNGHDINDHCDGDFEDDDNDKKI